MTTITTATHDFKATYRVEGDDTEQTLMTTGKDMDEVIANQIKFWMKFPDSKDFGVATVHEFEGTAYATITGHKVRTDGTEQHITVTITAIAP